MRFIASRGPDARWKCHLDGEPEHSADGPSALASLRRCCRIYAVDPDLFREVERVANRVVFATEGGRHNLDLILPGLGVCQDCHGTGKYVGLNTVETCQSCGGSGEG